MPLGFSPGFILSQDTRKGLERARRALRVLVVEGRIAAPTLIRLAWHDAATYCARTRTGGANGSVRRPTELSHAGNQGLGAVCNVLEHVKRAFPSVTRADLFQLAGAVGVELCGGPVIDLRYGRKDSRQSAPANRLPDEKLGVTSMVAAFERMGLSKAVFLASLNGPGRAVWAPLDGTGDGDAAGAKPEPTPFGSAFYKELVAGGPSAAPYHELLEGDPELAALAVRWARDEDAALAAFAAAHQAISELGCGSLGSSKSASVSQLHTAEPATGGSTGNLDPDGFSLLAGVGVGAACVAVVVLASAVSVYAAKKKWKARLARRAAGG